MVIRAVILIAAITCLASCNNRLQPVQYIRYIEDKDNGFRKEKVIDHWVYKVQYKPARYIYLQENRSKDPGQAQMSERAKQLKDWLFFNIYVSNDSLRTASPIRLMSRDLDDYNLILDYYLNRNKENISLHIDSTVVYPTVYNYENNYNLSPEDVLVVGFRLNESLLSGHFDKMVLVYDDDFLKTGILRFVFSNSDLKKEPIVAL